MDRIIEKKRWPLSRLLLIFGGSALILLLAWLVVTHSGRSRLRVDPSRLTVSRVENGEFEEYYPSSGWVEPETSYYLDVEQGGRVAEIFAEGGQYVHKGDLILRFSNDSMQRQNIETETRLLENLDQQQNTQFSRTQNQLLLKDQLLDLEYQIHDDEKKFRRYKKWIASKESSLSVEQFENIRDELEYKRKKRDLLKKRIQVEDELGKQQLEMSNKSIKRINLSLELLNRIVESMDVRAPISGYLSSFNAEIGQNVNPGQRIGQIDLLDKFKIRVEVDQYYLAKVHVGTTGKFDLDGKTYSVTVKKIYPEVKDNQFEVDMTFVGEQPKDLKRGQELTVELSFSEPTRSLMVAKGGFYQETSGRWVYLIAADGQTAHKADIRLGRQNPRYVEVLEGLKEGDWIITSGYDAYNEVDELDFTEPLQLGN